MIVSIRCLPSAMRRGVTKTVLALIALCCTGAFLASDSDAATLISLPTGAVAQVDQTLISDAQLRRARSQVMARQGSRPRPGTAGYTLVNIEALGDLLDRLWIQGEAAERGVSVSRREVSRQLKRIRKRNFPTAKKFRSFLKLSRFTRKDVLVSVRLQLLSTKIQKQVAAGCTSKAQQQAAFAAYIDAYRLKWRARTTCRSDLATDRCSNGPMPQPKAAGPAPC